ncbi:hypothetical protein IFM89_038641 [Coptis chinensis]|uniref:TSL-kinase interacting protein 1 n=1 Tax=Coptis chinensis TaxID=261450 RepID=A0A835M327_9MAGN|nr:hypothetical protein IFM89_038641 [Coptis chinensis]
MQPRRRKTASIVKSNRAPRKEARIKLQLFPIGESTRKALEKEGYNPHLELTISRRKKISSVLRHLKSKWGSVNIQDEIVLFPFDILLDNLAGYRRWTSKDTNCTAADVYESIGNPAIFRLRYGWFTNLEPETMFTSTPLTSSQFEDCLQNVNIKKGGIMDVEDAKIEKQPCETVTKDYTLISGSDSPIEVKDEIIRPDRAAESLDKPNFAQSLIPSSSIWTDNLTNISIGGLLSEASLHAAPAPAGSASCLQQIPFSCDSFDAAIAAHIYRHSQQPQHVTSGSHSSFLDAEETCHAFPSQKFTSLGKEVSFESAASVSCIQEGNVQAGITEDRTLQKAKADSPPRLQEMDSAPRKSGKTGVNWSNPFGLLDLSLSSSRQLVTGDNISLSGFLPNSLDAFQNCSLFARDTKVAPSSS